jgi:hypothetical protein
MILWTAAHLPVYVNESEINCITLEGYVNNDSHFECRFRIGFRSHDDLCLSSDREAFDKNNRTIEDFNNWKLGYTQPPSDYGWVYKSENQLTGTVGIPTVGFDNIQ